MFSWLKSRKRDILAEADELMEYYGDGAYYAARKKAREAREQGDRRQERFYSRVALRIARFIDKPVGADTATRMLYDTPEPLVRPAHETLH